MTVRWYLKLDAYSSWSISAEEDQGAVTSLILYTDNSSQRYVIRLTNNTIFYSKVSKAYKRNIKGVFREDLLYHPITPIRLYTRFEEQSVAQSFCLSFMALGVFKQEWFSQVAENIYKYSPYLSCCGRITRYLCTKYIVTSATYGGSNRK